MRKQCTIWLGVLLGVAFVSTVKAADPPSQDMLLWVKADAGVMSDAQGVATWEDQSGNGRNATRTLGTMQHTTATFGTGEHDVIRFNKDGFFALDTAPFRVPDVTIFAVAQQTGQERRSVFSTYSNAINFGYGYHLDMEGPNIRAFSSEGSGSTLSDWIVSDANSGMKTITAEISSTAGVKTLYTNGTSIGTTTVPGMSFFNAETASIGTLGQLQIDHFYFRGDIAEILVYSSVSGTQRAAVESYLLSKYFVPEPSAFVLLGVAVAAVTLVRWK